MAELRKAWTEDEDHAIRTLVRKHGVHRWSDISKRMLDHFGPPGRSGKQCRERWHNHLNPKINKAPWTEEEEKILFETHHQFGNRWKRIADELPGRTDNDIKNKFYSTMRKKLRKINKLLGKKNSTSSVKDIKPKILSNIFASANQNAEMKEIQKKLSKMIFEFDEKKSKSLKNEEKNAFLELIEKINGLNEDYIGAKRNIFQGSDEKVEDQLAKVPLTRNRSSQLAKKDSLNNSQSLLPRRLSRKKSDKKQALVKEEDAANLMEEIGVFDLPYKEDLFDQKSLFSATPLIFQRKTSEFGYTPLPFNQEFMMQSPTFLRGFKTPLGPTPGTAFVTPNLCRRASGLQQNDQTFNNIIADLQDKVRKNNNARN